MKLDAKFYYSLVKKIFSSKSYRSIVRYEISKQIYTSFQKCFISLFLTSVVFGSIIVAVVMSATKEYGLSNMNADIIVRLFAIEIAPLITVLLIMFKISLASSIEFAQMRGNREFETMKMLNIDTQEYLYIPLILSGIINVIFMSYFFSIMLVITAFLFSHIFFGINFAKFAYELSVSVQFYDVLTFFIKCAFIGIFIFSIPARSALETDSKKHGVGSIVSKVALKLLFIIMFVEVVSLATRLF